MKPKVFYLKTCNTSMRILRDLGDLIQDFERIDIKEHPVSADELDQMKKITGSYEALFSKRAKKYKEMGLKNLSLTDEDYRYYILQDYTFLKRPVFWFDHKVFAGNSKKTIEALKQTLSER